MRGTGSSLRRAVAASVAVHVVLGVGLVALVRWHANRPEAPTGAKIDTRCAELRLDFAPEPEPVAVVKAEPPPKEETGGLRPPLAKIETAADSRPPLAKTDTAADSRPPLAVAIPSALPPELLTLIKKPSLKTAAVVEVPIAVGPSRPQPAAPPMAAPSKPAVPPVHGALNPGQTIVYVLDASGSMGEYGKFDLARRSLIATLRAQPPTVRFQVVVYSGIAFPPLPAPESGCVPANEDNIRLMELALGTIAPAGRSNHFEGVKLAVGLRPDVVLVLTDADDLTAAKLRGATAQAPRPVTVCVAKVSAERVGEPKELK